MDPLAENFGVRFRDSLIRLRDGVIYEVILPSVFEKDFDRETLNGEVAD